MKKHLLSLAIGIVVGTSVFLIGKSIKKKETKEDIKEEKEITEKNNEETKNGDNDFTDRHEEIKPNIMFYYGCPNSKNILRLNTKKSKRYL